MKKKYIKTNKVKILECLDRLVWLIPFVICYIFLSKAKDSLVEVFREDFGTGVIVFLLYAALLGVFYVPLMMIWRSVTKTLKKQAIKQTTFSAIEDLEYYRDELTGISPATISMCVDFDIERDKDIAAQLLKFSMLGLIEAEGTHITVLPQSETLGGCTLSPSDYFLLEQLENGQLKKSSVKKWEHLAEQEVLKGPYIARKREWIGNKVIARILRFFSWVPFVITIRILEAVVINENFVRFLDVEDMSDAEFVAHLGQDISYLLFMLTVIILAIALIVTFILPLAVWIKALTKRTVKKQYVRTKEGDMLTEQIYGLKNFIHDFSALEYAQKETLVLWDDFLIYAVVLEENACIVDEITAMRNLKIVKPEVREM